MYDDIIQRDHWIWVYDNLNMSQRVRHEREGVQKKFNNNNIYPTGMCMTVQLHRSGYNMCNLYLHFQITIQA